MATEDAASGGSVVVAEALRQRAARERARWEAFQRTRDDERARGRERWAPPRARATSDTPATRDEGDAGPSSTAPDASRDHLTASAPSPRDPSAAAASDADADDDAPQCRICFSGAEAGRLFAPCHCRGTMRHVHVACLDAWRNASARANNASYHACDQCGFRYRTERGAWASFLEDPKTADRLAWTAISAAVTLAGTLSRAVSTRALVPLVARVARALRRAPVRYGFEETPTFRRLLARADALAAPRPSHDWRGAVAIDAARAREPSRARSRAARAIPPPRFTSSLRFTASSGGPIRGRRGGTPRAPRDGSPVARLSPTRSTVSSPARSSSARRGAFGNYVESFAPTRGPCFSPSRRSSRVTRAAPVDFFSSARRSTASNPHKPIFQTNAPQFTNVTNALLARINVIEFVFEYDTKTPWN